jgi:hypothetical protein
MAAWTNDELDRIGRAAELAIVTIRRDGTPRKPVIVWVVRHGDGLYARSAYGPGAGWFRGTQACREGRVSAGGLARDVVFSDADPTDADQIDAAYREKYRRHGARWVNTVVTPEARSATVRLMPR